MQTRLQSFIEQVVQVTIGYIIAIFSQLLIFPMFGIQVSLQENLTIAAWFTCISIVRGYLVRRGFNWLHHRQEFTTKR